MGKGWLLIFFLVLMHTAISFNATFDESNVFFVGEKEGQNLGVTIETGFFNSDSIEDILLGETINSNLGESDENLSYVFYGSSGRAGTFLPQDSDFRFTNSDADNLSAKSMAYGDYDGDGNVDVVFGAPLANSPDPGHAVSEDEYHNNSGKMYIFLGDGSLSIQSDLDRAGADFSINGSEEDDYLGYELAMGDFDGDGYDDIFVSAPYNDEAYADAGKVYLFREGFNWNLSITLSWHDLAFEGISAGSALGYSMASGDFNGDGYDDFFFGAPAASPGGVVEAGQGYIFFGGEDAHLKFTSLADANITLDGTSAYENFGISADAGDIDGDGYDDLIVGVPGFDVDELTDAGQVKVFFGKESLDSQTIFDDDAHFNGSIKEGRAGWAVASADFNNDGKDDIIAGAPTANHSIWAEAGTAYSFYYYYHDNEPDLTAFDSDTTRLSDYDNIRYVQGFKLADDQSSVRWNGIINLENADFEAYSVVDQKMVSFDTANLHESIDSATFVNISGVDCENDWLYHSSEFLEFSGDVKDIGSDIAGPPYSGQDCDDSSICKNVNCENSFLTFDAMQFSSFGADTEPFILPLMDSFSIKSTNLSDVRDVRETDSFSLVDPNEEINVTWSGVLNLDGLNLDSNVVLNDSFVSVNAAALHDSLNSSTHIKMENVDCENSILYYSPEFNETREETRGLTNYLAKPPYSGQDCSDPSTCLSVTCDSGVLEFDAIHFSSFLFVPPLVPDLSSFGSQTTDVSLEPDITSVDGFSLFEQQNNASVSWLNPVNLDSASFPENIWISNNFVSIDEENLHDSLNSTVRINFTNVDCNGWLYYDDLFLSTAEDIKKKGVDALQPPYAGQDCFDPSVCSNVVCENNELSFEAPARYSFSIADAPTPPKVETFSEESTDLTQVESLKRVENFTLKSTDQSSVEWEEEVDVDGADLDANIEIKEGIVSVNTKELDESFNRSARVSISGVDCVNDWLYYSSNFENTTFGVRFSGIDAAKPPYTGQNCTDDSICRNVTCQSGVLKFKAMHFYSYGVEDQPAAPDTSGFSEESTNLSQVASLKSVENLFLKSKSTNSSIRWDGNVDVDSADMSNIFLSEKLISVNSAALHNSFDGPARVVMSGVDCERDWLYYQDSFRTDTYHLEIDAAVMARPPYSGQWCFDESVCRNVTCSEGRLIFDAQHFDSFGAGGLPPVPEFSDYAMILALSLALGIFVYVRKR